MIRLHLRLALSKYNSWIVYCGIMFSISLLLVRVQASSDQLLYTGKEARPRAGVVSPAQDNQQTLQLEPGKSIERELAGDQSHSYQIFVAGQYIKLAVGQRGIDVVAKLYGPGGKQIIEFDSEHKTQGRETVEWVAEEAGSYRLDVLAKQKNAAGRYDIQVVELRLATENDRALHEARKLHTEFLRLYRVGRYDEARPLAERVMEIRERVLGKEHPDVGPPLYYLANLYVIKGKYAEAEPLFQRALTILESAEGPEHPAVAAILNSLATLSYEIGDYAKAETFYQRALPISEKALGPDHPHVAGILNNLASLYYGRGDYAKAEQLYQRALNIREKVLGPEHPDVAASHNLLAHLYINRGDYAEAEQLFQRALTISKKALGPDHPHVANSLINLANLYNIRGDYAKAETFYQRALTISEKGLGPEHPRVAGILDSLVYLYYMRGDYAKAEQLYRRALAISEKALGPHHPHVAGIFSRLAMLYAAKGEIAQAVTFQSRVNAIDERNFTPILALGSERQKLAYLALFSIRTDITLSLHSQAAPDDPQALDLAFTTLLRRKARGLDAMTDTIATLRRRATPEDQALFDKLTDALSQLATLTLKEPDAANPDTYRTRLELLEAEVDKREAELSSRSAAFREQTKPVTLATLQAALPADSALVEFAYFMPLDPQTGKRKPPRYLAYLLSAQGRPKWVDLGEAVRIDRAVDDWREALRDPNRTDVKRRARALDEKLMRPVRSLLSKMPVDTRHLLIAPDGSLNLIPFAALVDERNRYLIERYSISYLTSGRDLLRLETSEPSKTPPLVVANPDFGRFASIARRGGRNSEKSRLKIDPTQIFFQPLPDTEDEALVIKGLIPNASVLRQEEATEAALKQASGPHILHIATHGFFLDYQESPPAEADLLRVVSEGTTGLASTTYTVQLEAIPVRETAREKAKQLKAQGVNAYIVKSKVNGKGTFFRLRVGNFPTQAQAQKYGADLQGKGVVGEFFVARYESPQADLTESSPTTARAQARPADFTRVNAPSAISQPLTDSPSDLRLSKFAAQVKNPLVRSGLALAGANHGKSGDDDGLLTALEAAYLDLLGTKLVVLSACDTGVGEVKNGEGVQGLRRALVLAGSESQVMSLWPVSDDATKDLMISYYKALRQGEGRSEGLRRVQLRMLRGRKDQRHPFYWAAFIQSGEWANLDGRR
jgi:CHAT domain-containing protein/tetratricopeptide (TPR) repeat protein